MSDYLKNIKDMIAKGNRPAEKVIFDDDPKRLVEKVIKMVEADRALLYKDTPHI